jgi:hypothetical protein
MICGPSPYGFFLIWTLVSARYAPSEIRLRAELTNLDFDTELPRRFTVVEFDASGKPKPFSSADERDVEPCF